MPEPGSSNRPNENTESKILQHEWYSRTFRSREKTEDLLRPELEAGNITYNDYASAVQFLPNIAPRLLPFFFSVAMASSVAAYGLFKKPPWPRQKLLLYGLGTAFMSNDLGEIGVWKLRQRWISNLENQHGFQTAMHNIETRLKKEQMGILMKQPNPQHLPPSPIPSPTPTPYLSNSSSERVTEDSPAQWNWQSSDDESKHPPAIGPISNNEPIGRTQSRWEEIRRAQQQSTPQRSTWERIREGEIRDSSTAHDRRGRDTRWTDAERERAIAQAEFDQLLEKERQMGSE